MPLDEKAPNRKFDKSKLWPSRHVSIGPDKAPHRSYYYAMGTDRGRRINRPFVAWRPAGTRRRPATSRCRAPGPRATKKGVNETRRHPAGVAPPSRGPTASPWATRASKSSLVQPRSDRVIRSRKLTMRGHCYDGLVGLAGCDKSLPGMMMAMVRAQRARGFMYGGSNPAGQVQGPRRDRPGCVRGGRPALRRQQ